MISLSRYRISRDIPPIATSLSLDAEYIPVLAFGSKNEVVSVNGVKKLVKYNMEVPTYVGGYFSRVNRYNILLRSTLSYVHSSWVEFSPLRQITKYLVSYGTIFHVQNVEHGLNIVTPMVLLTVKSKQIFNVRPADNSPDKFAIVVNPEFQTSEIHKALYRIIKRDYLDPKLRGGVDIVYSHNIEQLCYPQIKLPKLNLNTFSDYLNVTKEINRSLPNIIF